MKLKAEGITRDFFRNGKDTNVFTAVQPSDIEIESGELVCIMGRSGSGKTTLVNMLCGLLTPTQGKVTLDDTDLYALSDDERSRLRNVSMGIVPQGQTGLQSLTVLENILSPAAMYGNAGSRKDKALELMEKMDIAGLAEVYSNELSGGELRRLAIARALINDPDIIIADEPTGDLDDETTDMVMSLLRKYADDGGAVLIVTHEKDAEKYADRTYRMQMGMLIPSDE